MRGSPPAVAVLICCLVVVVVIFLLALLFLWHYILSKIEKVFQFFPSFGRRWFIMKFIYFYCHEKIEIFFLEFTDG